MFEVSVMRVRSSLIPFFVLLFCLLAGKVLAESVWIDVRSALEYSIDHIDGDIRISHGDIVKEVSQRFPDKSTAIRLYCRSGGRAGMALDALKEAGYTDVKNVGSIDDARQVRGLLED